METNIIISERTNENTFELSAILNKIHVIRGYRVMLDFDIAEKYEVETKRLKEAVRRNIRRFEGEDFMFELTKEEIIRLSRSQFATLNIGRGSNIKYPPFAFTQLGVAMLSGVLNSEKAIDANRKIMRAFVAAQDYTWNYAELKHELDNFKTETKTQINDIFNVLDELTEYKKEQEKPRNRIGFRQKSK